MKGVRQFREMWRPGAGIENPSEAPKIIHPDGARSKINYAAGVLNFNDCSRKSITDPAV
jgi:hypothetical protein